MQFLLIPFSFIYFLIISLRNIFYRVGIFRKQSLGVALISVGNITWGGTGKTPAVLFIAETLLAKGRKVAILTRGYGGDESALFSRLVSGVPVMVGKDRVKSGLKAIDKHSVDTLLLDDGFQYTRLKRDLDIVCIDATNPFGNGCLIPTGSMREGLSGLKRADVFLITRADLAGPPEALQALEEKLKGINPCALIVKSIHRPGNFYKLPNDQLMDVEPLRNKDIVLVSAIGNPRSFEETIRNLGLRVKRHFIFRDHHWYRQSDLKRIEDYCIKNKINTIVTTEKDAIRLRTRAGPPRRGRTRAERSGASPKGTNVLVLSIKLEITENEQEFNNRLFGIYNS